MNAATAVTEPDRLFDGMAEQMQSYEILGPEDRRERYFFFGGDVGGMGFSGGVRVDSQSIPRKTLYRCMVTPCVTTRKMELTNLIPTGAMVPGSADRIKAGCAEYWLNAGPEAERLIQTYGNPTDKTRNLGLVELAPQFLRGKNWETEVKPLMLTKTFFPTWPNLPVLNSDLIAQFQERLLDVETTDDPAIAANRELYVAVGQDMLRALEAADEWQNAICQKTAHGLIQPRSDETHKRHLDDLDNVCFMRTGLEKPVVKRVNEEVKRKSDSGLTGDQLEKILDKAVAQQPAINPEALAAAIAVALPMAIQMMQQQQPAPPPAPTPAKPKSTPKKSDVEPAQ